jgi:D-glycero-alpha-D-manno-heptose-7-phosphate kinase
MQDSLAALAPKQYVRARAPLRLGLAGGGSDLPAYCDLYGGAVLNVTIDRFAYAHILSISQKNLILRSRDLEKEEQLELRPDLPLDSGLLLHRGVYRHMMNTYCGGEALPMIISTSVDVPHGSGLGASSALVVALIEAFRVALQLPLGPYDVAQLAYDIERKHLGLAGGKQDQYAAAFGGLNFTEFLPGGSAVVNPLRMRRDYLNELESSLVICFSGQSRRTDAIVKEQVSSLQALNEQTISVMHRLKQDAADTKLALLKGQIRHAAMIMNQSWRAKKSTAAGVSTAAVDSLLDRALKLGAWGGKISGAGGGGFVMLYVDPEFRYPLISALSKEGVMASGVKFTFDGAEAWSSSYERTDDFGHVSAHIGTKQGGGHGERSEIYF